ncbi:hypothetical protein V1477_011068 [Vespula maculifrons]|uniref:RDD domain-containing protein n=1 Tax=Vespula maculifrons TaxID=7453 RepID=A0ABD2C4H9_VESMC
MSNERSETRISFTIKHMYVVIENLDNNYFNVLSKRQFPVSLVIDLIMVMTFVQYPFGIFQLVDQNRKRGWKESELTVCLTNTGQLTRKERRYFRSCLPNQPERINWIVHVSGRASKASENLNDRFDSASDLVIRSRPVFRLKTLNKESIAAAAAVEAAAAAAAASTRCHST